MTIVDAAQPAAVPGPRKNRAAQVYEELRMQIVQGALRPNQRLIEVDIAGQFAVSRTPVRESLQRLAAEGLVVPVRRGWAVKERTLDEIREIYEVREALEGYAARLAAERIEPAQLAVIASIAEERERIARTPENRERSVATNDRFHSEIFHACGNARLIERIERNCDYYYNVHVAALYNEEDWRQSARQHFDLVAALRARNSAAAEQTTRQHIRDALRVILERSGLHRRLTWTTANGAPRLSRAAIERPLATRRRRGPAGSSPRRSLRPVPRISRSPSPNSPSISSKSVELALYCRSCTPARACRVGVVLVAALSQARHLLWRQPLATSSITEEGDVLKFGLFYNTEYYSSDPDLMAAVARHAEECGFESLYAPEQCLAYVAAVTSNLLLGTAVLLLPYYHPVALAQRLATIDVLSAGRMSLLTVGLGTLPGEAAAAGVDFRTRGRRADEAIDVLRMLWGGDAAGVGFQGEFFSLPATCSPSMAHGGRILPIHVGGSSLAAARRAGRRGDGYFPRSRLTLEQRKEQLAVMRAEAAAAERDPTALEYTQWGQIDMTADDVQAQANQGVTRLVVSPNSTLLPGMQAEMSTFARRVGLS